MNTKFEKIFKTIILPLVPMILWGSLFPMVKIGYKAFDISGESVADILMFAAFRFTMCGAILCIWSLLKKEKIAKPIGKNIGLILLMSLFAIVLHYACSYVGLVFTDSSKTAILKQIATLVYVCFAFLFVKEEKFSISKIIGAIVGFAGILAINAGSGKISFSIGEILILLASVCSVVSSIISVVAVRENSPYWITGISQLAGGIVLAITGFVMGGRLLAFNWWGQACFYTYVLQQLFHTLCGQS